jgi:hypothetical protein
MIIDKTAEKLALLYGNARLYFGEYLCASTPEAVAQIKQDTVTSIRECYKFIPREQMQKRFPEIDCSLDSMFQHVKI